MVRLWGRPATDKRIPAAFDLSGIVKRSSDRNCPTAAIHSSGDARNAKDRVRSATQLVWHFLRLLIPYRLQTFWILASATVATLIGLLPPAGTKFIIDYGLNRKPVPEPWLRSFPVARRPQAAFAGNGHCRFNRLAG